MADVKISQLPAATTPLAGTEEVPLVQSGVTKKATVNEIVAVAGAVTSVTATSPLASSGGSTPDISLTGVVDVAHGGTNATTASGARTNLGAAASGANSDITSMSGITGAIGTADYVAFDTAYSTTLAAGQLGWDGNNTLGLGMAGGNVIQHIGEDSFYYIKASSTITKGQVVMFTGAVGASGVPTGAPATGVTDGSYIMGVAAEGIANNAFGLVQFQGILRNVNTSGFADGDILWYDPAVTGGLTKTKPSAPNVKVQIAATVNGGSAGGGTILVRVNAGSVLGGTDSNVQFSTLANGNIIQYDSALGYWKNVAPSSLAVTTFSGGTTGLTPATATAGAVTLGGTLAIANGGTGQTTANAALNALLPSQTGNNGKYLTTDGSNTSWAANPLGTVTSVDVSGGTTGLTTSGGPITSSGTITLAGTLATTNGGTGLTSFTANGVVYASSTSALTTGSALQFDGTNLGVATTPSAWISTYRAIDVGNHASVYGRSDTTVEAALTANTYRNSGGSWIYKTTNVAGRFGIDSNGAWAWYQTASGTAGTAITWTQAMTLNASGNLGIGTTSPSEKLHVAGNSRTVGDINAWGSGGTVQARLTAIDAVGYAYIGTISNHAFLFYTNSAERARIDTSGNLGLGVTPSAWRSGARAFQSGGNKYVSLWEQASGAVNLSFACYESAANTFAYTTTGDSPTLYSQLTGAHRWYTAPSGTAGGTISFTQAMTLDANGNLGVGTTSPGGNSSNRVVKATGTTSSQFQATSSATTISLYADASQGILDVAGAYPLLFQTNSTERARISSTGTISLGAAPGSESLRVTPVASAVNYVNVRGGPTGIGPIVEAFGSDTSIDLYMSSKGSGRIGFYTNSFIGGTGIEQFRVAHTASAVNYLQATGAATGGGVTLSAQGSDTNIGVNLNTKGTGSVFLKPNNGNQIAFVASPSGTSDVNYLQATGSATGTGPTLSVAGSDTNINLSLKAKGTGNVLVNLGALGYGTGTGGAVTQATSRTTGVTLNTSNGAITLVSAAGTTSWQSFTVTNSTVAATDVIHVSQQSGTDLYQIFVTNVAAGSFKITFATTGGTTTEQPVFNFAVMKAVTS